MNTIVSKILDAYKPKLSKYLNTTEPKLDDLETQGMQILEKMLGEIVSMYVEHLSEHILKNKTGRKKAQLVLHRKADSRRIYTRFGELSFKRDYYLNKQTNTYYYPIDEILGLDSKQRISNGLGLELATAATKMSYAASSQFVANGEVSNQTVMNQVRTSQPCDWEPLSKTEAKFLHIDADEDHVTLTNKKKGIVPLISVYEGIGQHGKRNYCKNVFHISEYGLTSDQLWEKALTEIDKRYELDKTKIYIHGDGAGWIDKGKAWFPNCTFVLDKYHKNKYIKSMCAGVSDCETRLMLEDCVRDFLASNNQKMLNVVNEGLITTTPARTEKILKADNYLRKHIDGIQICATDQEANNGGCSEPHVSHVLSSRLSSRPRVWSETTLSCLAPMLANRRSLVKKPMNPKPLSPLLKSAIVNARKKLNSECTLGTASPCAIGNLYPLSNGKITPGYLKLKHINNPLSFLGDNFIIQQ
jgi:hypothetical protein